MSATVSLPPQPTHVIERREIKALLHPGEQWRFVLAEGASIALLVFVVAVLASRGVAGLAIGILVVGTAAFAIWWSMQLLRSRLLGNSVRVTPATFPEVQTIVDEVCEQLGYQRRIDVYIGSEVKPSVALLTYLGTHIILIDGGLVADLLAPDRKVELRYLVVRHVGALKAKHFRFDLFVVIFNTANALQIFKPFLLPYLRVNAYSGDQIGMTCCADLEAALRATAQLMVGKELAPALPTGTVVPQAAQVTQRILPRLTQLLSAAPHRTNRYLNLLAYGRAHFPEDYARATANLANAEREELEALWSRSPHRPRS
jgi:hypothetical protein